MKSKVATSVKYTLCQKGMMIKKVNIATVIAICRGLNFNTA